MDLGLSVVVSAVIVGLIILYQASEIRRGLTKISADLQAVKQAVEAACEKTPE